MFDAIKSFIQPDQNPDLTPAFDYQKQHLPTLWLVGKTGAGKSTLIQFLTQSTQIELGNGFAPCTQTASYYDFPQQTPLMRFLDTRGLGEAHYDPSEDIKMCQQNSHALVIVAKVDEVEQGAVVEALRQIKQSKAINQVLIVHTGVKQDLEAGLRGAAHNQSLFEAVWGSELAHVEVDFMLEDGSTYQTDVLIDALSEMLPIVGLMLQKDQLKTQEEQSFSQLKSQVLWYSTSASASDLIPGVGLVSVPAIQAKMLHSLANQYGVDWNKTVFAEFIGTLGASFGLQYGIKLGTRQLVKLVPVYGQTIGAVTAAAMSFATTFGLGRAASYYFYHQKMGDVVTDSDLQAVYKAAFEQAKKIVESKASK